jgi:hypothetical protein
MAPGNQHFDPQGHKRSNGMNFLYLLDVNRIESPPEQWLAYIFSEKKQPDSHGTTCWACMITDALDAIQ